MPGARATTARSSSRRTAPIDPGHWYTVTCDAHRVRGRAAPSRRTTTAPGAGTWTHERADRHHLAERPAAHDRRQGRTGRHPGRLARPVQRRRRRRVPRVAEADRGQRAGWRPQPPLPPDPSTAAGRRGRRRRRRGTVRAMRLLALAARDPVLSSAPLAGAALGGHAARRRRATASGRSRRAREVVAGFDPPATTWGAGHRGVDLLGHVGPAGAHLARRDGHLRRAAGRAGCRGGRPRRGADDVRTGERERRGRRRGRPRRGDRHPPARLEPLLPAGLPALGAAARRRPTSTR